MLKKIDCNLCKSNEVKVIFEAELKAGDNNLGYACTNDGHGQYYRLVECSGCGLRFSSPREENEELEKGYFEVEDELYEEEIEGRRFTFKNNLKNLSKRKPIGKLLDVGCSIGVFLDLARKDGWEVYGIEPSEWCVNKSKELFGLSILNGTYKDIPSLNNKFDVISMWDVLEHLGDPLQALKYCHSALKDDGILVFSTLDAGSLYARMLGRRWPWLMKMHIYYFNKDTIRKYLKMAGFTPVKISTYRHIVSIDYLLHKLKKINRFFYFCVKFFKFFILLNRNIFITVKMGDFMEIYARKDRR